MEGTLEKNTQKKIGIRDPYRRYLGTNIIFLQPFIKNYKHAEAKLSSFEQPEDPEVLKLLGHNPAGSNPIIGNELYQVFADRWTKY